MRDSPPHHRERRRRSLSPRESRSTRDQDSRRDRSHHERHHRAEVSRSLPYSQRALNKHDLEHYEALFAEYLQLQKGLDLSKLSDSEAKGRWKSFIGKWNRGELAHGWYEPAMLQRAVERSKSQTSLDVVVKQQRPSAPFNDLQDSEDDDLGPSLPDGPSHSQGPAIPSLQDLQYQRELKEQDQLDQRRDHQYERKLQRKTDKERLEDLVPRADPGSRERQLEKKRDTAVSNRAFAEARESGAAEIPDTDLMGDDGIDAYKAKMRAQERQKNEREIRKEEILRARAAEREERLAEHRQKEAKTMETLRALAQQRYGSA